eukprot:15345657-Ditylum_brightwellii.AAC.1
MEKICYIFINIYYKGEISNLFINLYSKEGGSDLFIKCCIKEGKEAKVSNIEETPPPNKTPALMPVARMGAKTLVLNTQRGKSSNEVLQEGVKKTTRKIRDKWIKDVKEGRVKTNCPISLLIGHIIANVNRMCEGK